MGKPVPALTPEQRLALAAQLWDWKPHDGQRQFLTARLPGGGEPKTLVAACGRRWGKTEALGMDCAIRVLTEPELGQLVIGPTKDQAEGVFDSAEEKLLSLQEDEKNLERFPILANLEIKRSPYAHIRRKSDGAVILSARSAGRNGRNIRGKGTTRKIKRFRVVVDEAAFVPDAAIREAIMPMLATVPGGGQLVMISSPFGKRGAFFDGYTEGERGEKRTFALRLPSDQNPLVDAVYLAEQRDRLTDRQFRAEYLAEFVDAAGAVFLEDDITACTIGDEDLPTAPLLGMRYVAGVDFGRRGDYTAVCVLEITSAGTRLVELWRGQGLTWTSQLEQVVSILARWDVCHVCPDRTGVGDPLSELLAQAILDKRLRCLIDEFIFTGPSKQVLIDALAIAMSQRRIAYPAHPVLMSELRNFEVVGTTPSGREKMEARTGHDDTVCALALAERAAQPYIAQTRPILIASGGRRDTEQWSKSKWDGSTYSRAKIAAPLHLRLTTSLYRSARLRQAGAFLRQIIRSR